MELGSCPFTDGIFYGSLLSFSYVCRHIGFREVTFVLVDHDPSESLLDLSFVATTMNSSHIHELDDSLIFQW
jgi:hypothetical protein